jgi:hypothetical protein
MRAIVVAIALSICATSADARPKLLAPLADQAFGEGDCGCELHIGSGKQQQGEGITVRVEYTVTKTCPKNGGEDCEGIWLKAKVTATVDGVDETISASGYSGC